jgi:hypothetical protein
MADRPTREFKTAGGHTVILNDYITGEENRQIRSIYIKALRKPEAQDEAATEFEADNKAIELSVASVDGSTDNVVQRVLDLPLADFKEVVAEVQAIVEAKKNSKPFLGITPPTGYSETNSSS